VQSPVFRFADFELDRGAYALRRGGLALSIERIPLDLLFLLLERRGDLVTRAEILDRVWGKGVFVHAENAVNTAVRKLRRALNDDSSKPRFVATVPTKGYRFIGAVEVTSRSLLDTIELPGASDDLNVATPERLIVGREKELARLRAYFLRASQGARQMVFVTGEPGIGKTTVMRSFCESLACGSEARIGRGQCIEQYGSGEPYMPVLEALARLCHEADGKQVIEVLNRVAPSWLAQMPALLSDAERERLHGISQGVTQSRMLREMAEALEVLTRETPLVVVFEDLHWSDVSTLELIATIGRRSEPARLLVIGTYRPVEMLTSDHPSRAVKEELQLQRRCEEIELRLLSEEDVASYLSKRFPDEQSSTRIAPAVHRRTEGNPLFMVNVVDYLVEQGSLKSAGRIEAPPTIQRMIQRNLERLDNDEQQTLEAASVAGVEFSAGTVAAALGRPLTEIETCCWRLARRDQFISATGVTNWPDGSVVASFRLNHSLYGDVLHARVPPNRRVQLHQRIAECLEAAYRGRANEIASELAHHYRSASHIDKAILYLAVAGEHAFQRAAHADSVASLAEALLLLNSIQDDTDRSETELRLQIMLGGTLTATKGFAAPEVKRSYSRALELCKGLSEPSQLPALHGLWVYYLVRGEIGVALELAEKECLRLAESAQAPALLLQAHLALGGTLYYLGDFARARVHIDQSLAIYDSRRHQHHAFIYGQDPGTIGGVHAGLILWNLGFPDQALDKATAALRNAEELQYPLSYAFAAGFKACVHQARGEAEGARKNAEIAITLAAEYGFPLPSALGLILCGWALAELGAPEEGIKQISSGLQICEAAGALLIKPYFLMLLAEAYRKADRIEEGRTALAEALTCVKSTRERSHEADILRLQAWFVLAGETDGKAEAEQLLRSAIELARLQSAKSLELRATSTLARLLATQGRREEARTMLTEIYNWFTEGFDTLALKEAKASLEALGATSPHPARTSNRSRSI
jgi:predicted ATPase/DNA-binding winged helix-turn-helix (wHTH) protein